MFFGSEGLIPRDFGLLNSRKAKMNAPAEGSAGAPGWGGKPALLAREFRVGFEADFGTVHAHHLVFLTGAHAEGELEGKPDDGGSNQNERRRETDTDQLAEIARVTGFVRGDGTAMRQRDDHRTPDAADKVSRDGADNVVDLQLVEQRNREDR